MKLLVREVNFLQFFTLAILLIFLYISTIVMIWGIVMVEVRERGGPSFERGKRKQTRLIKELVAEIDLREIAAFEAPTMEETEIIRVCKLLGLPSEDYLINNGLELEDLLNNSKTQRIRELYNAGSHDELQYLAEYRIRLKPRDLVTRVLLIKSFYTVRDYERCIERCNELIEIDSNNIDAERYLARSKRSTGDELGAFEGYSRILQMEPEDTESLTGLARFYFIKKEYSEALKYSRDSLRLNSSNRTCLILQSRILERIQDYEESLDTWDILLEMNEEDLEANIGKGKTLYQVGRDWEAKESLENALRINNRDSRAKRSLVSVLSRMGLLNEALDIAYDEVSSSPTDVSMWDRILVLHLRMGNFELAEKTIDEIIWKNGGSLQGHVIAIILSAEFQLEEKRVNIETEALSEFGNDPLLFESIADNYGKMGAISKNYEFLKRGEALSEDGIFKLKLEDLGRVAKRVSITIEDIEESLNGSHIHLTELLLKRIIQRTCVRNVNTEWENNKSVAMISSSLGRGGAERQVVACLNKLNSDDKWGDIRLFCNRIDSSGGRFGTFEREVREIGVEIKEIGFSKKDRSNHPQIEEWSDLLNLLPESMKKTIIPLFEEFVKFKPSVVHSWQDGMNIDAAVAALMAGVPRIVLFARSMRTDEKSILHMRRKRYLKSAYTDLLNSRRVLLAHNSMAGAISYSDWLEMPVEKFEIIHNGVDFDLMEKHEDIGIESELSQMGILEGSKIVGGVFRIVEEKQPRLWVDVASEVVKRFDDVHFVIVGGGQMLDVMRGEISDRGLSGRIHLIGQRDDVSSWLKRMQLFLLTSRVEGLPNVLIEAQGFGVPVISTSAGGSEETFKDNETGRLSRIGTKEELVDLLDISLKDDQWLQMASEKSRSHARAKFSVLTMYSRLLEIYEEAKKYSKNEERPVISSIGTCRVYLPMRRMANRARLVINDSGFETSYLHSLPEISLRMNVLKGIEGYSKKMLKFQCNEAGSRFIPGHFSLVDSDILLIEISSMKTAISNDSPLQLNNVIRELCDNRGEVGKQLRREIDLALSRNGEINLENLADVRNSFSTDDWEVITNLKLMMIEEKEVAIMMKEISDSSPIPVVFVKHINVEGSDGKIIWMRDLLSTYMDRNNSELDIIDPTPLVLREGRERMLEDSGMDVNHYSDYGVSVVGNWMAEEIERRVGKGASP